MVFKAGRMMLVAALLASCGVPPPRPAKVPDSIAAAPAPPPAAALHIVSRESEIRLLVYRSGPMARLGHNHVIVSHDVNGWVEPGPLGAAGFSLRVPAAQFLVDEQRSRETEGADFPPDVGDDARAGTLHNMLGPALLDAAQFPDVTIRSTSVQLPAGAPAQCVATLEVGVAGHTSVLTVPFRLDTMPGRLRASGEIKIRQSDLGLTPFSVMMGALQVQDQFTVKFDLVAEP